MKKKKILTLTIAFFITLTVLTTALFTQTNHANAAGVCNNITDCNGFYYDLNGARYNADGMKRIADDISKNGNKSQWYETILNNSGSGKVLIDNKQYDVYLYNKNDPYNSDYNKSINHNAMARDASKNAGLTFYIASNESVYNFKGDKNPYQNWRDSELRKTANTTYFNSLPESVKTNIEPIVLQPPLRHQSDYCLVIYESRKQYNCYDTTSTIDKIYTSITEINNPYISYYFSF